MMKEMLVVVLVALTFLQSVMTQNEAQSTEENHSFNRDGNQPTVLNVDQYLLQMNNKLNILNSKIEALATSLSQHMGQLAQLQTSISSTNSKLDVLTVSTTQLSTEHQQIQASISDVECVDTTELNNLTHQLEILQHSLQNNAVHTCGGTGGWRRVAYMDFTDPCTACPSSWQLTGYLKRTCGRANTGSSTCDSVFFPVSGGEYSKACGRIKAYQWGSPDAFHTSQSSIDENYVDGVSVTHGNPRQHIWTFAGGLSEDATTTSLCPQCACPCDNSNGAPVPAFVGEDYFCESALHEPWDDTQFYFHPNDPLWDGHNCPSTSSCCSLHDPPYFVKSLPSSTTDDIEARICLNQASGDENIAVELIELYIQ